MPWPRVAAAVIFPCASTAATRTLEARFLRALSKSLNEEAIPKPSITGKSRSVRSASHSPSPSINASKTF